MSKNFIMCPNGHYYDPEQYSSCPHCNSTGDYDVTVSMTVPSEDAFSVDDKTLPDYSIPENAFTDFTVPPAPSPLESSFTDKTVPESMDEFDKTIGIKMWNTKGESIPDEIEKDTPSQTSPVVGWLVCTSGVEKGQSYTIVAGKNFIGRNKENDIVIKGDNAISRDKHAVIIFDPRSNKFHTQPGTSNELFYLNDEVVLEVKTLNSGDNILVGNTELKFIAFCNDNFSWDNK